MKELTEERVREIVREELPHALALQQLNEAINSSRTLLKQMYKAHKLYSQTKPKSKT